VRITGSGKNAAARGLRRAARAVAVTLMSAGLIGTSLWTAPLAHADDPMISVDNLRDGWDRNEPGLAPAQVTSPGFGRRFSTAVDGQVDAQPIVAGPTVIVATENNKVYGIDSTTGAIKWGGASGKSLGPAWPAASIGCGDLTPNIGVTSTPVYDAATGTVYLTAKINDGPSTSAPHWRIYALDAQTGATRPGWPITIQGAASNNGGVTFNPFTAQQRPGLLLLGGAVYAGFASFCDHGPYVGWLVGVDTTTRAMHLWSTEPTNGGMAGIWQGGGGLMSDGAGRIFFSTGNGTTTPVGPGSPVPQMKAEAIVRVGVNSSGTVNAKDFFAPADAPTLDAQDRDFGSGGPAALDSSLFGVGTSHPNLLVQVGKAYNASSQTRVYLLDRDNLGGRSQGSGGGDAAVGITNLSSFGGVWGHPGVWGGDGGYIYVTGASSPLTALKYSVSSGKPAFTLAGKTADTFPYGSGSPVITSTGTNSGSALVWVIRSNGSSSELRAYDPVPTGTLNLRWKSSTDGTSFTAAKFTVPATDGSRVYVGTKDGHLLAFGRVPGLVATPNPLAFGSVANGMSSTQNVTVQNNSTSTETITATTGPTAPFSATMPAVNSTIAAGASITIPVTFAPTAAGGFSSSLSVTGTDGTASTTATVQLTGSSPGLVPQFTDTDWQRNGSATFADASEVDLTPNSPSLAGSAFYKTVIPSGALHANFTVQFTGGNGDGITFTMLDPALNPNGAASLGTSGGGLGYSGLHGVAVTLDTFKNVPNDPSSNFTAIATSGSNDVLTYAATNSSIPSLLSGPHTVDVTVSGGHIVVKIDNVQYLNAAVTLPPNVLVGFTAATGHNTALQISRNAAITF
jgi:hypothetical protein